MLREMWSLLLLLLWLFCMSPSASALDIPKLQGYVNDYADMISPETKNSLEAELQKFEVTDSTQIVVLTVPSLEGEDLEGFSIRVADAWKIGQKLKDNGVVLLVAKEEKKIRIEVGRGLEGRLTDLTAGRIIDLVVKPRFKRGDFNGGFVAGIHAIIEGTRGEFTAEDTRKPSHGRDPSEFLTFLIFSLIFILVVGNISRLFGGAAGALGLPALVSSFFSVGSLMLSFNGWDMARLWLWLLAGAMLTLVGVQLFIAWIVMRVLEELSQREVMVEMDLQAK